MANKTQTTRKPPAIHEYIPNDGPALHSHIGAHVANVDQRLAAVKDNRELWDRIDPPARGSKLRTVGYTGLVALALLGAKELRNHGDTPKPSTKVVTVQPGEFLSNVVNRAEGGDEDVRPEVSRLKAEIGTDVRPGQKIEVRVKD